MVTKKRVRAFTGLAGSPLAVVCKPSPQIPKKRGRPRIWNSDADRMRANRAQQQAIKETDPLTWERRLSDEGLSMDAGRCMTDADHGKGLLHTGGYDNELIAEVVAARERDGVTINDDSIEAGGTGRRVKPKGHGISDAPIKESDDCFVSRNEKQFLRSRWKTPPKTKLKGVRLFCVVHKILQPASWDKTLGRFVLECCCQRDLKLE